MSVGCRYRATMTASKNKAATLSSEPPPTEATPRRKWPALAAAGPDRTGEGITGTPVIQSP
jgi:hypothetical protein